MNPWLWAAFVLMLGWIPCMVVVARGDTMSRLVAFQMAGVVTILTLLLLAEGYRRPAYFDVGLTLAMMSFASGQVWARFLERWL